MNRLEITPWAFIAAAAGILLLPFQVLAAALLASVFHELCHLGALAALGIPVFRISVGIGGAKIHTSALTNTQELLCAASGPAGSLLLCFLADVFPVLALFGLFQGLFNLLPVYPFDGGRILRALIRLVQNQRSEAKS